MTLSVLSRPGARCYSPLDRVETENDQLTGFSLQRVTTLSDIITESLTYR